MIVKKKQINLAESENRQQHRGLKKFKMRKNSFSKTVEATNRIQNKKAEKLAER